MLAVDANRKLGQTAKANETLKQIVDTFPESPLAAEAAKKLGVSTSGPAPDPKAGQNPDAK